MFEFLKQHRCIFGRCIDADKRACFSAIISQVNLWILERRLATEQMLLIDYLISAIKIDLWGAALCGIFANSTNSERTKVDFSGAFPILAPEGSQRKTITFEQNTVIATPWEVGRLSRALVDVNQWGFVQALGDYNGTYYPEIKLIVVGNGLHHSAVASLFGEGSLDAYEVSFLRYFDTLSTDGAYWYNSLTDSSPTAVKDVRFAILYELARRKNEIEQIKQ